MRNGKIFQGHTIPYGTLADASTELRLAYYTYGNKDDSMLPELPCPPIEEEEYIDPIEEVAKKEMVYFIQEALDTLTPRVKKILSLRFGLGTGVEVTLYELAGMFDVTRERIRQIETKGLRDLRHPFRSEKLKEFVGLIETPAEREAAHKAEREREAKERREEREEANRRHEMYQAVRAAKLKAQGEAEKKLKMSKQNWQQIRPMLEDADWIADLRTNHPIMYQELKYMVGDIWGGHSKKVWDLYTLKKEQKC